MKKAFSSFAGRRLTSGPRPKPAQPASRSVARLASPRPSPAPRWPASARLPADAPRRAPDRGRACPPRGGHAPSTPPCIAAGLRPRPRARLHLLVPVRSLTPSRAAFLSARAESPKLCPSPRPPQPAEQIRRLSSTLASNQAPAAPPRSPALGAHDSVVC